MTRRIPPDIVERIKRFAPEHKRRLEQVLDAVVYSDGKPNKCDAISLSKSVAIEDEPFPYVISPMDEEAWIWTDGIRAKRVLHRADIDFDCCVDEHEALVEAIAQHPTLKSLHFNRDARFVSDAFRALFRSVRNLEELVVTQRAIASPICDDPNVMDRVFAGMMERSRTTLHTLKMTLVVCRGVCATLPRMHSLENLLIDRFRLEVIPDLRGLHRLHTVSIRYCTGFRKLVQMLPATLKSLHLEYLECSYETETYEALTEFIISTHGQLESFRIYTQFFNQELFFEKMGPVLSTLHFFTLYGPEKLRSLEVPGFERETYRYTSRYAAKIKFSRPEFC